MTVRTEDGTRKVPVPQRRRTEPVLDATQVAALASLGQRIEELYGRPMDIEWAELDDEFFVVQARPITALPEPRSAPDLEVWNDSLAGDYCGRPPTSARRCRT